MSRKDQLILTALRAISERGLSACTAQSVADDAHCSRTLIPYYFGTHRALIHAALLLAVESRDALAVLEGLTHRHPAVAGADAQLRAEALSHI